MFPGGSVLFLESEIYRSKGPRHCGTRKNKFFKLSQLFLLTEEFDVVIAERAERRAKEIKPESKRRGSR